MIRPSKLPRAVHLACHADHVRGWPLHAKVWADWGIQGWVPAVVIGHARFRVRVRFVGVSPRTGFDPTEERLRMGTRSPNNLRPRKSGEEVPPPKKQYETCLFFAATSEARA